MLDIIFPKSKNSHKIKLINSYLAFKEDFPLKRDRNIFLPDYKIQYTYLDYYEKKKEKKEITKTHILLHDFGYNMIIPAGWYQFPFCIYLPTNIPNTFSHEFKDQYDQNSYAHIYYY